MATMDQHAEKLLELVLPLAAKRALELGFDKVTAVLSKVRASLSTPQYEIEKALDDHQKEILRWADEVSFSDTTLGRRLSDVFVPLNVYLSRRRSRFDDSDLPEMSLEEALAVDRSSCIVLGQPGAGKTTAVKHLCQRFFADTDYLSSFQVLLRIELRQINLASATQVPEFIRRSLQEMLHLRISYPDELAGDDNASARRGLRDSAVLDWLNAVHALIVLDGFDEITHKARRDLVVEELRKLAIQLTDAAFFLTTRTGEFSAHIERTRTLEVKPFSKAQIAKFASNWLGSPDDQKFITQLEQSPYHDTAIRPLTLAHLCVIFEKSKRIPAKPKTIYRRIVRLLLEDWDEQRSVVRESSYADFAGNHVIGIGYNASGDVINDGTSQYLYDAEGRVCAVKNNNSGAQVGYIYNAEGQRVAKGTITAFSCDTSSNGFTQTAGYVIGPDGEQVSEGDAAGNWVHTNVYAAGHLIATYENDGLGVHFHLSDWLGTRRVQTDYAGNLESTYETLPYGELIPANQSLGATEHLFTGKERDTESGLDYFGARYYASSMGRFMSPDWSAKAEPVPYSKLDNPQSLNLYAYVGNNPLSRTDPTGHADILAECKGQSTCNKTLVQTVNIVHQDKKGNTVIDSTLKVTTKFSLTTDAKGNVTASASSTVANVSGHQFSDKQLATMGTDIGTMQQAAVTMGFGPNTTQLVTAVGAAESHFGTSPPYAGAPAYMNPAINPMQLIGKNGANLDLNHNVDGGMDVLDWAGRPSTFDPTATYSRYSDHSPTTMSNWDAIYGSINEQQP